MAHPRSNHTMPFKDICALARYSSGNYLEIMGKPISENAHLWLWITNPFLVSGYGQWLLDAWGFTPKTMATWIKGRLGVRLTDGSDLRRERRVFTELIADPDDEELIIEPDLVQHFNQGRYLRGTTEHCILAVRGNCPALVHDLPNAFVHPGRWEGRLHSEKPDVIHEWAERLSPGPRLELFARRLRPGWYGSVTSCPCATMGPHDAMDPVEHHPGFYERVRHARLAGAEHAVLCVPRTGRPRFARDVLPQ